jgi:hypothetical protein
MYRIENESSNNSCIVACVFVDVVTFLPNCCLATIVGYTYRYTDWREGFMKYAAEMGWSAMIYVWNFIQIGSAIEKLVGGEYRGKHREHGDCISLLLFFQNKESNLKHLFISRNIIPHIPSLPSPYLQLHRSTHYHTTQPYNTSTLRSTRQYPAIRP